MNPFDWETRKNWEATGSGPFFLARKMFIEATRGSAAIAVEEVRKAMMKK